MAVSAYTIASSSSGNSVFVTDGATCFLIDDGLSFRRLSEALAGWGVLSSDISAVFITHEHSDHISGLGTLCKKCSPVIHAAALTAQYIDAATVEKHPPLYSVRLGDFLVSSFMTSHDSKASLGYTVSRGAEKLGVLTDTGFVSDDMISALSGCFAVILESNYDEDMLLCGAYPADVKRRIMSSRGHLSNAQCAEALPYLYKNGTRRVLLAHISPENNTPKLAMRSALVSKEKYGLSGLTIDFARKSEITRLI